MMLNTQGNPRKRENSSDNIIPYKNTNQQRIGPFALGQKIGQGTFGVVRIGTHLLTGEKVAIKVLEKRKVLERGDLTRVEREIKILKSLRHNNIIQLYSVIQTNFFIYLIMEYASGKELFDYIVAKKKLKENEACRFFQQMISGVEYIHKLRIVHRDFKPENLLLDYQKNIKIVDFGLSNLYGKGELLSTPCGSPCYAAPEMILGNKYEGIMVDIWSCGVILYAMICGFLPFEDNNNDVLYKKITNGNYNVPKFVSELGKDLIKCILTTDPKKRYSITQIKNHPWFHCVDTHLNMHEGLLINFIVIPIDEEIVEAMLNFGFSKEQTRASVLSNRHNHITTAYYLLLKTKIKKGRQSISDLVSKEFEDYKEDPENMFVIYNYDYANVVKERAISPTRLNEVSNEEDDNNEVYAGRKQKLIRIIIDDDENEKRSETMRDINKILTNRSFTPSKSMKMPDDISNITSDENISLVPQKKKMVKKDKTKQKSNEKLNKSIDHVKPTKYQKGTEGSNHEPAQASTSTPTQQVKTIRKIDQIKRIQDRIKQKVKEQYPDNTITAQVNTADTDYLPTEVIDKLHSEIMKDYIKEPTIKDSLNTPRNNHKVYQSTVTKDKTKEQKTFKYKPKDNKEEGAIDRTQVPKIDEYCPKTSKQKPQKKSEEKSPCNTIKMKQVQIIKDQREIPKDIVEATINNHKKRKNQKNFFNTAMSFERECDEKNVTFDTIIVRENEEKPIVHYKNRTSLHTIEDDIIIEETKSLTNNKLKNSDGKKKYESIKKEDNARRLLFKKNLLCNQKKKYAPISPLKNSHIREMTDVIQLKIPIVKDHKNANNINRTFIINTHQKTPKSINLNPKISLHPKTNESYTERSRAQKMNIGRNKNGNKMNLSIDNSNLKTERYTTIRKTIKEQFNQTHGLTFYHPKQVNHNPYNNHYCFNTNFDLSLSDSCTHRTSRREPIDYMPPPNEIIKEVSIKEGFNFENKDLFIPGESREKSLGDKLKIWEGPIDSSTIFFKTPQAMREDLIKVIVSNKIYYKVSKQSNYKLVCQKYGLKFDIEIVKCNELREGYFVKFRRIEGSFANYRELTTVILDKILLL